MPPPATATPGPQDIAALGEALRARRDELRADVARHRGELTEPASATSNTFVAGAEGATNDADDEMEVALWQRSQAELDEIEAALTRLDAGTYGACERCGEPIGLARLQAKPESRRCLKCQAVVEASQRGL